MINKKRGISKILIILASALLFIFSLIYLVNSLSSSNEDRISLESELSNLTAELNSQGYSWFVDSSNYNLNFGGNI